MTLRQLSLFLENRPGQLRAPCEALGRAGVDILTLSLADATQYGILRLVVDDWVRAKEALEVAGAVVHVTEVLPIEVDDGPGGLAAALAAIEEAGLGVEYMYPFPSPPRPGKAAIVFRFDDMARALEAARGHRLRALEAEALLSARRR